MTRVSRWTSAGVFPVVRFRNTLCSVGADVPKTRIELRGTVDSSVRQLTVTLVVVDVIDAVTVETRTFGALIDVRLTVDACVSR